jgi:hypothetical protein
MISKSEKVCWRTLSIASEIRLARLYVGMMTLTVGILILHEGNGAETRPKNDRTSLV